ncbi:MAG: hypothetical protein J6S14_15055 [Clostridia bacterium]|nr:hypothetical protein [Clostridia bacterium]
MEIKDIMELIITVVAGILTCVPLAVQLVKYVKNAVREKNWADIMELLTDMMADAEKMFATGPERKEWILENIELAASHIDYEIDLKVIGNMIDVLCIMSKQVNPSVKEVPDAQT